MTITSAAVLFATIWFLAFLILIPIRLTTQGDAGRVVPGTHSSSPHEAGLRRKAWVATALALALSLAIGWLVTSGLVTIDDIDWFRRGAGAD